MIPANPIWVRRFRLAAAIMAGNSLVVGLVVLVVGWWLGVEAVASIVPGTATMKANTAVGIILAGAGILSYLRGWSLATIILGAGVFAIGGITELEYLTGATATGFDQLLAQDSFAAVATVSPGRMGANSAFDYILLGLALILLGLGRAPRTWQTLAFVVSFVAYTAILGYLLQVEGLTALFIGPATQMAVNTSVAHLLLSVAIVLAAPDRGRFSFATTNLAGGRIFRAYALPLVAGIVLVVTLTYHVLVYLDASPELSAQISSGLVTALVLIGLGAVVRHTNSIDKERDDTAADLRQALDQATSVQRLESLFSALPEAEIVVDTQEQLTYANRRAVELYGGDLVGVQLSQLVPQSARGKHGKLVARYLAQPEVRLTMAQDRVVHFVAKNQTVVPVEIVLSPVDVEGESQVVATVTDLRPRMTADKERRRLASVAQTATDAIVFTDLDDVVDIWNDAAEELYGWRREEMIGSPETLRWLVESEAAHTANMMARARAGVPIIGEVAWHQRRDGSTFQAAVSLSILRDDEGNEIGISRIIRDLTAQLKTEDRIRELNDELTESNKKLQQYAFTASHDLQAPLRRIVTFSELLLESLAEGETEDAQQSAEYMQVNAQRMQSLVRDLLAYSRVDRDFQPTDVAVSHVVEVVWDRMSDQLGELGGRMRVSADPELMAYCDETQLTQLLQI